MFKRISQLFKIARKLSASGAVETVNEIYNIPTPVKIFFNIIAFGSNKKINNIEKKPISMKIISTHKNYYIFEFSLVGDNEKRQRGKIIKISEDLNLPLKF